MIDVILTHLFDMVQISVFFFTFGVNISSVTLNLIKGMLYQETERWENLREKGPKTRKPFAAHSRLLSFLPNQLCILIYI